MAETADRIVTMGCSEACPAVGKPLEDWGIEDPSGETIEDYRRVRDNIGQKIGRLLDALATERKDKLC